MFNTNNCMSRKNKKEGCNIQCPFPRKNGDYCLKHYNSKKLLRIDDGLLDNVTNKKINKKSALESFNDGVMQGIISYILKNNILKNDAFNNDAFNNDQMIKISGPAFVDPCLSHDSVDPISHENIWTNVNLEGKQVSKDIHPKLIFSYVDNNNFVRCFNIESIIGLFEKGIYTHPITGDKFSDKVIELAKEKIEMLFTKVIIKSELNNELIKNYTYNVFDKFRTFNIYLQDEWFLNLNISNLQKLYFEMRDFFYKNIDTSKYTNLFTISNYDFNHSNILHMQYYMLYNIEQLILTSDNATNILSSYIVLCSLSIVCPQIKQAYPDIVYG